MPHPLRTLAAILVVTAVVYAPLLGAGFVTWDDPLYVNENPTVERGLHAEGLRWALTTRHDSNWIPLTWLSHMLDVSLHGSWAGGHHLTNLLLHLLCTALLFAALRAATGQGAPSVLAAALFALHPLHVEPVAWISQRKELLAAVFGLLAIRAHVWAVRRGGGLRRASVALAASGALLSKPMWVTLPFVLLLLDLWPLGRTRWLPSPDTAPESPRRLLGEKWPLWALSAAVSAITFSAQEIARVAAPALPLSSRLANAVLAPFRYLGSALWPADLSIVYPHPWMPEVGGAPPPPWAVPAACVALVAITAWALVRLRRRPYLLVGWLWFLGTLVPVSGVVQVGVQGMADRYTYVPLIGIFVATAFGVRDGLRLLAARWPASRAVAAALAVAMLSALAVRSHVRVGDWRDSETLYRSGLALAPRSTVLLYNRAVLLARQGRVDAAREHYEAALAVDPEHPDANNNLANILLRAGHPDLAIPHYRAALRGDPESVRAHQNLGRVLRYRGDLAGAVAHFERALAAAPEDEGVQRDLRRARAALARQGAGAPHPPE